MGVSAVFDEQKILWAGNISRLAAQSPGKPAVFRGFFARADGSAEGVENPDRPPIAEAPIPCLVAISVSTLGCVALFFYAGPMFDLLRGAVVP